ncbi:hypothetical protein JIR001_13810 [Polycladomyces abyssicola]|uniref:Uncharacterized protein n=1 Tax=Polycladomyces abyssicola TaxID=1125966 RepID=A0A8D5UF65_9BACL|nr:hypothetical protein JIR001_13810 [Polycladomyces abyssicola]
MAMIKSTTNSPPLQDTPRSNVLDEAESAIAINALTKLMVAAQRKDCFNTVRIETFDSLASHHSKMPATYGPADFPA